MMTYKEINVKIPEDLYNEIKEAMDTEGTNLKQFLELAAEQRIKQIKVDYEKEIEQTKDFQTYEIKPVLGVRIEKMLNDLKIPFQADYPINPIRTERKPHTAYFDVPVSYEDWNYILENAENHTIPLYITRKVSESGIAGKLARKHGEIGYSVHEN